MPREIINSKRRTTIRENLSAYLKTSGVARVRIALFINERPEIFGISVHSDTIRRFLDPKEGKVGNDRVAALELYLKIQNFPDEAVPPLTPGPPPELLAAAGEFARFFPVARAFFGMNPGKVDQYRDSIIGTYAFYAYSERNRTRVCRGAIAFRIDAAGDFCVEELQKSVVPVTKRVIVEKYSGHFLFRKNVTVVILTEKKRAIPKFYILSIENYHSEDEKIIRMTGVQLKIGEFKNVFTGNIYLTRNENAFNECDVVPPSEVPPDIMAYLDDNMWESR